MSKTINPTFPKKLIPILLTSVVLAFFTSPKTYAQRTELQGKINAAKEIDMEGINVLNLSSNKGTVTNPLGEFRISGAINDTLFISAVHIEETTIILKEEQIASRKIAIHLNEKLNELGTVTLRRGLTGYVGTDLNLIPLEEVITTYSLGLSSGKVKSMSKDQRLLYAAKSGPMDQLISLVTGRSKMLKKRIELAKTTSQTESILKKFPETFFTDALKIRKFQIYSFLFFCEDDPDYEKIASGSNVEIIEFLRRKSVEFLADK